MNPIPLFCALVVSCGRKENPMHGIKFAQSGVLRQWGGGGRGLSVELLANHLGRGGLWRLLAALAAAVYVKPSAQQGSDIAHKRPRPAAESHGKRPSRWVRCPS